jgi:HPt (histidine-containing phosphotransfer) domain-containing protein
MALHATTDIDTTSASGVRETGRWIDVRGFVDRCMGNLTLANRVLARFRGGLDETLRQLDLLAAQEDWAQCAKRSHRLRGEAGNVGCQPLEELASQVEDACVRGDGAQVRLSLKELAEACGAFEQEVPSLPEAASQFTPKNDPLLRTRFQSRD